PPGAAPPPRPARACAPGARGRSRGAADPGSRAGRAGGDLPAARAALGVAQAAAGRAGDRDAVGAEPVRHPERRAAGALLAERDHLEGIRRQLAELAAVLGGERSIGAAARADGIEQTPGAGLRGRDETFGPLRLWGDTLCKARPHADVRRPRRLPAPPP